MDITLIVIVSYALFAVLNIVVIMWDLRRQYHSNGEAVRELAQLITYAGLVLLSIVGSIILFLRRRDMLSYISRKYDFSLTAWLHKDITIFN